VVSASTDPEAFGRVAVEAQAMGKPVVATRHGGSLETVLDGETGWLIEPGNARQLAAALDAALAMDAAERQAIASRGMAFVRANFAKELMCARTLDLYREVLAEMPVAHAGAPPGPDASGQVAA
jgi:glycosyltransferase involved in cell wall biosynthesis